VKHIRCIILLILCFQGLVVRASDNWSNRTWQAVVHGFRKWCPARVDHSFPRSKVTSVKVQDPQRERHFFNCSRLHSDTAFVIVLSMHDGSQELLSCSCGYSNLDGQIDAVAQHIKSRVVKTAQAVVVGVNGDDNNWMPIRDEYWRGHKKRLQDLGIDVEFIPYEMVPGADFRDRNHFNVVVGRGNISGDVTTRRGVKDFSIGRK